MGRNESGELQSGEGLGEVGQSEEGLGEVKRSSAFLA